MNILKKKLADLLSSTSWTIKVRNFIQRKPWEEFIITNQVPLGTVYKKKFSNQLEHRSIPGNEHTLKKQNHNKINKANIGKIHKHNKKLKIEKQELIFY